MNKHTICDTDISGLSQILNQPEGTAYLIKLHTHDREYLFGSLQNGAICLNDMGHIATDEWMQSFRNRPELVLDSWALLPNYIQGIVVVKPQVSLRETTRYTPFGQVSKPRSLSAFVAGFKAAAAKRINLVRNNPGSPVWERSYHERVLDNATLLNRTRQALQAYS